MSQRGNVLTSYGIPSGSIKALVTVSITPNISKLPPLSLYIHIPWCVRKCPYCDFNSHTTSVIPESLYIDALIEDLTQELASVQGRSLHSIFFGGGTPSLFSAAGIARILTEVERRISFCRDIEITLEANPGSAEQHKFSGYSAAGVNRLSIGVQSFNPVHLSSLGRIHSNTEAIAAADAARRAGISNFNIDLMHGLPGQTQPEGLADIQQAIDLEPTHISWYQLTIEPNTVFYNSPPTLPSDDQLADIQDAGDEMLGNAAFSQYEISAYSRDNQFSKHNTNYWLFGDYIGIGAGAHGKITDICSQQIVRRWKTRSPKDYLSSDTGLIAGDRQLIAAELPLEFLMNGLRLNDGFETDLFTARTGLAWESMQPKLDQLIQRKLLKHQSGNLRATAAGKRFLNTILEEF